MGIMSRFGTIVRDSSDIPSCQTCVCRREHEAPQLPWRQKLFEAFIYFFFDLHVLKLHQFPRFHWLHEVPEEECRFAPLCCEENQSPHWFLLVWNLEHDL